MYTGSIQLPFLTALQPGEEENEEHGKSVKVHITSIAPVLQDFLDFFPDVISFQHVLHFDVGRSQIEWNLKMKSEMSVCSYNAKRP